MIIAVFKRYFEGAFFFDLYEEGEHIGELIVDKTKKELYSPMPLTHLLTEEQIERLKREFSLTIESEDEKYYAVITMD